MAQIDKRVLQGALGYQGMTMAPIGPAAGH